MPERLRPSSKRMEDRQPIASFDAGRAGSGQRRLEDGVGRYNEPAVAANRNM